MSRCPCRSTGFFTYAVNGSEPVVGARVLVPFSGQRLIGVVVRLHDDRPTDATAIKVRAAGAG